MKKILLLISASFFLVGAYSQSCPPASRKAAEPTRVVIRCGVLTLSDQPLLVVDGIPLPYDSLPHLDPNQIERIDVLKGATAQAIFGAQAGNGVILITTKHPKQLTVEVVDSLTGEPVAGASVAVRWTKEKPADGVANKAGKISLDRKTGSSAEVEVSCVGYHTIRRQVAAGEGSVKIALSRKTDQMETVVVQSRSIHCIRCGFCCRCSGVTVRGERVAADSLLVPSVSVFPNPASRSQPVTLRWTVPAEEYVLTNAAGQLLQKQALSPESRQLSLSTNGLAAGVYFIRLQEKGKPAQVRKLVIQ